MVSALMLTHIVLEKLPHLYVEKFDQEGVFHEVKRISTSKFPINSSDQSPNKSTETKVNHLKLVERDSNLGISSSASKSKFCYIFIYFKQSLWWSYTSTNSTAYIKFYGRWSSFRWAKLWCSTAWNCIKCRFFVIKELSGSIVIVFIITYADRFRITTSSMFCYLIL